MRSWLPSRAELARERKRRYAAALRALLEVLDHPDWPPWPPEADGDHHAWVRAHWTIAASDLYDVLRMVSGDLELARLHVLGQDLLDLGDDVEAIRSRIAADGHDVWEEGGVHDWRAWVATHWRSELAEALERDLRVAATALGWVGDHRERLRQRQREHVAREAGLLRFDLSEQEMAPYLERRVCGIRGATGCCTASWKSSSASPRPTSTPLDLNTPSASRRGRSREHHYPGLQRLRALGVGERRANARRSLVLSGPRTRGRERSESPLHSCSQRCKSDVCWSASTTAPAQA